MRTFKVITFTKLLIKNICVWKNWLLLVLIEYRHGTGLSNNQTFEVKITSAYCKQTFKNCVNIVRMLKWCNGCVILAFAKSHLRQSTFFCFFACWTSMKAIAGFVFWFLSQFVWKKGKRSWYFYFCNRFKCALEEH